MKKMFLSTLVCVVFATAASAQIAINEVLGDPARDWDGDGTVDVRGDEWVEIVNLGEQSVDLQDYCCGTTPPTYPTSACPASWPPATSRWCTGPTPSPGNTTWAGWRRVSESTTAAATAFT